MRTINFVVGALCLATTVLAESPKLDLNDVSSLWPPSQVASELAPLISMDSFSDKSGEPIWSDQQFVDLHNVALTDAVKVNDVRIVFDDDFKKKSVWRVAGMRVDPTAGGHGSIRAEFGSNRQIRLIVQPVTKDGSVVTVHDGSSPPIASEALPKDNLTVRNFGWFIASRFIGGGPAFGAVTQRTANETAEVVEFIERNFRCSDAD